MGKITITDLTGGRNGVDNPSDPDFPDNQSVEALNIDYQRGELGRKRPGSDNLDLTGGTAVGNGIQYLGRFVVDGDETTQELWLADGNKIVKRRQPNVNWADVVLADAITGNAYDITSFTFNNKLWLLYQSGVNRAHLFDKTLGVPKVRRVGLAAPTTAPVLANAAPAGAYATVARYARVRWLQLNGLAIIRRSEPGIASASFTPSGANSGWTITQPIPPANEDETHWEIEVSTDNVNWYLLYGAGANGGAAGNAAIPIATLVVTDTTATTTFSTLTPLPELLNYHTNFPSARFGITDNNRVILAGSFELASEAHQSRIWLSPVLASADTGDDERTINSSTFKLVLDLNEKDGGNLTGLGGFINGVFWAFKYRQIIRCTPTSDATIPYQARRISNVHGSINHVGIVLAEDVNGNPALYFPSPHGFYRLGVAGLQYMGRDIEDVWFGFNGFAGINLAASVPCFGIYHPDYKEIWWWIAEIGSNTPNRRLRLNVRNAIRPDEYGIRGGWQVDDGNASAGYCAAMFANTLGVTMSKDLKPYLGRVNSTVYRCDSDTALDDAGTAFQAYVKTKSVVPPSSLGENFACGEPMLIASPSSNTELQISILRDFEAAKQNGLVDLTADGTETSVVRKAAVQGMSEVGVLQMQFGDVEAVSSGWSLDVVKAPILDEGKEDQPA